MADENLDLFEPIEEPANEPAAEPLPSARVSVPLSRATTAPPPRVTAARAAPAAPAAKVGVPAAPAALPGECRDHTGVPLRPTADLFAPAPPDIGPVLSAGSTVDKGKPPVSMTKRLFIAIPIGLILATAACCVLFPKSSNGAAFEVIFSVVVGLLVFAGTIALCFLARGTPQCSYVGRDGIALFKTDRNRSRIISQQILRFADADELFTGMTRRYVNGGYVGTNFFFRWIGRASFGISGQFNSKDNRPPVTSLYYFGRAAENAWNQHVWPRYVAQLNKQGYMTFRVNRADFIAVGKGFMEFQFGGRRDRIETQDIARLEIRTGQFHIASKDAHWLSRKGKFSFPYANMGNPLVFVTAVSKLVRAIG